MPETHSVNGLQPAVLNRIDGALEQLDLLMDLAAEFRYKELQILAGQSYNIDRALARLSGR
jgi:hypothetical protein